MGLAVSRGGARGEQVLEQAEGNAELHDAEVIQIVSYTSPRSQERVINVTWIDQRNGDLAVYETDIHGAVNSMTTIVDGKLTSGTPAREGVEHSSVTTTSTHWADDNDVSNATFQIYGYRDMLRNGRASVVGETIINGRRALEVVITIQSTGTVTGIDGQVVASSRGYQRSTVFLDPDTLLVVKNSDHPDDVVMSYPSIGTFRRADVRGSVIHPEFAEAPNHDFANRISMDEARAYERHAVWWLGEQWAGLDLQRIDHSGVRRADGYATEGVSLLYTRPVGSQEQRILIESRGPLSDEEWQIELDSRFTGEAVTFQDEDGWLFTGSYDGSCRLELEWRGGYIEIHAPSVEIAFQVAEELRQVNGDGGP